MNPVRRGAGISKGTMRTAITVAIPHDGPAVFLSGPSVPIESQKAEIKKLKALREHAEYAEVQLWESGAGITSRVKFQKLKAAAPSALESAPAPESPKVPKQPAPKPR